MKAVVRFPFTACMLLTNLMQMKTNMSMKFNGRESEEDSKPKANRAARGRTETARRHHQAGPRAGRQQRNNRSKNITQGWSSHDQER